MSRRLRGHARFESADHLGDPALSIKANVVEFARLHGVPDVARVLMLASARTGAGRISYVFNPLSVHWCYRADGTLACLVAEVHNTYGERHAYLLRPDDDGRAEADKTFYVSPFFDVAGRYRMRFSAPGPRLSLTMALTRNGSTPFTATVRGTARPATARAVRRATFRQPFMSLRFSALIRLQGVSVVAAPLARRRPSAARSSSRGGDRLRPAERQGRRMTLLERADQEVRERFPVPRPDEAHWPGLAVPPRVPVHARIAEAVVRRAVASLPVGWSIPRPGAGDRRQGRPGDAAGAPDNVFARLGADVKIGFGEAYMTGDWTTGPGTDLADLLTPFAARMSRLVHPVLQRMRHVVERTSRPTR